jgi:L-ascorbate metabolism protein UlaG (beta-lactamase superfamily)
MDIQFHGANCITINTKGARITIDDNLSDLGAKKIIKGDDVALFTGAHGSTEKDVRLLIDQPGEYEAAGVAVYGIAARSHLDEEGKNSATMYKIIFDDMSVLVTGHIYPELSDTQLETIGTVDVLLVPVGGSGYTLDAIGALKVIKEVEPKIIVPTHYDDKDLAYPVPQQALEDAIKSLGMEPKETTEKLRLKSGILENTTQLIILNK